MFLQEYIKLRTEQVRELTHLELDRNLQYVSNPWNSNRSYKEGMIVYFGDTSTNGTGLGWWRANKDNGPSNSFDPSDWDPIGASSISGNILLKDSNNIIETTNLLEFSTDFDITFTGTSALVEISPNALGGFWTQTGNTIYYEDNVLIGTNTIIDPNNALTVVGNQLITGDLNVSGVINGIDLQNFYLDYQSHSHTILPITFTNYNSVFPNSNGQLADVVITSLTNGDFLQWNSSINRWVNVQSTVGSHNLSFHSDVSASVSGLPLNNQILIYNNGTSLWENRTLITNNNTGFTGAPFSHNHDDRYWTKAQLSANTGSIINWLNIFNAPSFPSSTSEYVLMSSDVNLPDSRTLTGSTSINIIDNGPSNTVVLEVIPETTVQLININLNGNPIGQRPNINFISSSLINIIATDDSINNRVNVEFNFNGFIPEELGDLINVNVSSVTNGEILIYNGITNQWESGAVPTAPVTSVNSLTGAVSLGIDDLNDTAIVPGNFPGPGTGSPFTPQTNILAYDDDISKWVNISASQLLAAVSGIFLDDILDVNISTGLSDKDIIYYDQNSGIWLSGSALDANMYTITDLQTGALNNLYYTQSELSISGGGSIVHWDNIVGAPSFAPSSHTHFLYELIDVIDYSTGLPNNGDILTWNSSLQIWEPQINPSAIFSIISNSTTIGSYVSTPDVVLSPNIINSLEIQSDNGIILESDIANNIIKIGTLIDGTSLVYNTDGSISAVTTTVGVTINGKFVSGAQQTIDTLEVLDIPSNFEYNLFTLNIDGTAIIDGDLNIIDDNCCPIPITSPTYGRFGISDINGEFTYYSSLYEAMLAANSGDTIEAFASYTETINEVILKDGVNINFNGYTYTFDSTTTLTSSSSLNAFSNGGNPIQCSLYNGRIVREGGLVSNTDSTVLSITSDSAEIQMYGMVLENPIGTVVYSDSNIGISGDFTINSEDIAINASILSLIGGTVFSNIGLGAIICDTSVIRNSSIFSITGSAITSDEAELYDSTVFSILNGILVDTDVTVLGCNILSAGAGIVSTAISGSGILITSSTIRTFGGFGISIAGSGTSGSIISNNEITSFGGPGISINIPNGFTRILDNSIFAINGTGISSTSNSAIVSIRGNNVIVNRTDINSSEGIRATRTGATGEVIIIQNSVNVVVANLTAYALSSASGSLSIFYLSNQLRSSVAPSIGPNVIQGQVNTIDNFGNIELG
jgi:hypothetical protein